MLTVSRLKDRTFIITESDTTKLASEKLKAMGYAVTSTCFVFAVDTAMPSARKALGSGKVPTV